MRKTVASYLDGFLLRGNETAFAHRHGLRRGQKEPYKEQTRSNQKQRD